MLWFTAASLLVVSLLWLLYSAAKRQLWVFTRGSPSNPFKTANRSRKGAPVEFDQTKRDKVIKQSFSEDKVPKDLDAIVIGSGIGGLSTAAILARTGKKVLVLEQHDQAGGCCHTFIDKGFEFDVGLHYIGGMAEGTMSRVLMDQLSDSAIEWEKLEDIYDTVVFGEGGLLSNRRCFPIPSGRGKLMESLIESFPNEEKSIRKFFDVLKRVHKASIALFVLKLLPRWLSRLLIKLGVLGYFMPVLSEFYRPLSEVLDEITDNRELKAVMAYSFGDYGTIPKDAAFGMQAMLTNHFAFGGYYPRGGASEIAFNVIPVIEQAGGRVLVRSKVTDILLDDSMQQAIGVRVKKGHTAYEILAPLVISDAGVHNTMEKLLPKKSLKQHGLNNLLRKVRHGLGLMSVFIGLEGTKEELGLKPTNIWAFSSPNLDEDVERFMKLTPEEVEKAPVPLLFVSFPSTKDSTYNERHPGKSTCAIVTVTPYEWFEAWKDGKVMKRGQDYNSLKDAIGKRVWHQVCEMFPHLEDKLEYMEVGTPLSNQYYLGTPRGEVYGIDHDAKRFSPLTISELRPETPISGLYLTGQDIFVCGIIGAMYGGVLCASAVLKRNLMRDLIELTKQVKKEQKAKEE